MATGTELVQGFCDYVDRIKSMIICNDSKEKTKTNNDIVRLKALQIPMLVCGGLTLFLKKI